jgi:hypothetical protein
MAAKRKGKTVPCEGSLLLDHFKIIWDANLFSLPKFRLPRKKKEMHCWTTL